MKKLLVLPTWIIVRIIMPFLKKGHIWKGKKFTLREWTMGSTKANDSASMMMWVGFIMIVALILIF